MVERANLFETAPSKWPTVDECQVTEESAAYSEEIKSPVRITHAMVNMQHEIGSITNSAELQRFITKRKLI